MNQNFTRASKGIPRNVKRALLIVLIFLVCVVGSEGIVKRVFHVPSSLPAARTEALPEFGLAAADRSELSARTGEVFAQDSDVLADALGTYERDLLNHFGAAWVSPHHIDSSITQELFGMSPHQFESLIQTSQLLWNQQTDVGAMGLLGWLIEPQSPLTSSLTTHSAYLEKQGWMPVASNSETTLSLVKEQGNQHDLTQQSRYSWLLVELVSVGDQRLVLYSFQ